MVTIRYGNNGCGGAIITTVIPTYRRPALLKRAVKSALTQTRSDLIVRVFDNASGDETPHTVAELMRRDSRVRYFCHPENIGLVQNFQYGMAQVETPYFSFLSDDDLILPSFYEKAIDALEREPSAMLYAAPSILAEPNGVARGITLGEWKQGVYRPPTGLYTMLRSGIPYWTSVVFRREVSQLSSLDQDTGTTADYDFQYRIGASHTIVKTETPGAVYFLNVGAHESRTLAHRWSQALKIIHNIKNDQAYSNGCRDEATRLFESHMRKLAFFYARAAVLKGDREEALRGLKFVESYFGSKRNGARIRILLAIDRMGLRKLLPAYSAVKRTVKDPGAALAYLINKGRYQEIVDSVLRELSSDEINGTGARFSPLKLSRD